MTLVELFLPEFDQETNNTRKMLEKISQDRLEWRPHPKSMTMAGLVTHLVNIYRWVPPIIQQSSLDLAPNGVEMPRLTPVHTVVEALDTFQQNSKAAREIIATSAEGELNQPWSLLMNGKVIFTQPRHVVIRSTILNHLIHHRAQLGVYLRLHDIAVPGMYGPSADEKGL